MHIYDEIQNIWLSFIEIIKFTGSWTETVINVTLLVSAIYTFFFLIYIPILFPLRKLFKTPSIPFSEATIIAWKCRRHPTLFLRFYIETAIINYSSSQTCHNQWREIRSIFENYLEEYNRTGLFYIRTSSVSDIVTEEKKELIKNYFELCSIDGKYAQHNLFWKRYIRKNKDYSPSSFASNLSISNGYLAPMARITGLNDRFEQNWQKIINNYIRISTSNTAHIPIAATSLTYTWLMWGPSVQISYDQLDNASNCKKTLGIYGCGDEANSVHVAINRQLHNDITSNNSFCVNCSIVGKLHNPSHYIKSERLKFNPTSRIFIDRIHYSNQTSPEYIIDIEHIEQPNTPNAPGYFTAYIWAMFCFKDKIIDSKHDSFNPADMIVLFEHTNLADMDNYQFLCDSLISKIKRFFKQIATTEHGKYVYCCAMNHEIDSTIRDIISKGDMPTNVEIGNVSMLTVLESIDSHFCIANLIVVSRERYPDIIKLHYTINKSTGLQELCDLLANTQSIVVGTETEKGELLGICIMCNNNISADYIAITPQAAVSERDLEDFCRHTLNEKTASVNSN